MHLGFLFVRSTSSVILEIGTLKEKRSLFFPSPTLILILLIPNWVHGLFLNFH